MTASLAASPTVSQPSSVTAISGTGFVDHKTRLMLDGTQVAEFCDMSSGTLTANITTRSMAGTMALVADQQVSGVWTTVASLTITVTSTASSSSPLVITTNNQTVQDQSFTADFGSGTAIDAHGTSGTAPITNLTIRRCTFSGFNIAIQLSYVTTFTIEDCIIEDALYGGIMVFSGITGTVQRNAIRRIGYQFTPSVEVNAYGIAISRVATSNFTTDPRSASVTIDSNTVEDVPTWEGYDTHAGSAVTFSNNISRRCLHAFVLGPDGLGYQAQNVTCTANTIYQAKGTEFDHAVNGDIAAITIRDLHASSAITNNQISTTYPTATDFGSGVTRIYDYLDLSTGITVSGNTDIP